MTGIWNQCRRVAMGDLLGNDQYYFLICATPKQARNFQSFNIAIQGSLEEIDYAYGVFTVRQRYDYGDEFSYFEKFSWIFC
jgi:hypothetical protein